jgi:Tir chaperone family protein CesT
MSVDDLLREFGSRTGLGTLARNRDGICRLIFDGGLVIDIEAPDHDPDLYITAAVGPLETDAGSALLRDLLATNLMGKESAGAALALDQTRDEIVLCRQLPVEALTYRAFERAIESFLNHLERCRAYLDRADTVGTAPAADVAFSAELMIRA